MPAGVELYFNGLLLSNLVNLQSLSLKVFHPSINENHYKVQVLTELDDISGCSG